MNDWKITNIYECKIMGITTIDDKKDYIEYVQSGRVSRCMVISKPHKFNFGDEVLIIEEETPMDKSKLSDENKKYIGDKVHRTRIERVSKMEYIKPNIYNGACRAFNTPDNVCAGSDYVDKTRWCFHCACYHSSESNEKESLCKCDNGIIYKRIKSIHEDSVDEYLVEEFCDCRPGRELIRNGYSLKVFKNISI